MKRIFSLSLITVLLISCSDYEIITLDQSDQQSLQLDQNSPEHWAIMDFDEAKILSMKLEQVIASRKERQSISFKSDCAKVAKVPQDFPTIQEAVDAVCENGNVIVSPGIYDEYVFVEKVGVFIKAEGEVILNGGFYLGANEIKVHNFKIDATTAFAGVGIASINYNGFDIRENTIYGTGHLGIYFKHCDNSKIVENTISGDMEAAIYIDSFRFGAGGPETETGDSRNNFIANNHISDIIGDLEAFYPGYGIILRGDCDYNRVQGNDINTTNGVGISLLSVPRWDENTDNNVVKSNIVQNNFRSGIEVWTVTRTENVSGGSNNTIGPGNESYENRWGIFLYYGSNNNKVINNIALYNSDYDLIDWGIDNSFKNNTSISTFGVD